MNMDNWISTALTVAGNILLQLIGKGGTVSKRDLLEIVKQQQAFTQQQQAVLLALIYELAKRSAEVTVIGEIIDTSRLPVPNQPEPSRQAKQWNDHDIPPLVDRIYDQILERKPDMPGFLNYGSQLLRGEKSVRGIVKEIGLSGEYRRKFLEGRSIGEAVELCYRHFLGRGADDGGKTDYEKVAVTPGKGFAAVITALTDSEEYKRKFGEDGVPPKSSLAKAGLSPLPARR